MHLLMHTAQAFQSPRLGAGFILLLNQAMDLSVSELIIQINHSSTNTPRSWTASMCCSWGVLRSSTFPNAALRLIALPSD